jgi:TolA-binding protein
VGNKSGRTRKHVLFYVTVTIVIAALLNTVACAPVQDKIAVLRAQQQLEQYRGSMAAGVFETIIKQNEQVIAENETKPPADAAFYVLGEVYSHQDYKGKDYILSQYYFEKLIENFPDSPLASEAKTYISLFETIEAEKKLTASAEEKAARKKIIIETKKRPVPVYKPRKIVENQNFEEAVQENLQLLDESGMKKPADEALYNLGLIYAHVDNPTKDYKKSQNYFYELIEQFPESELTEEARIWLGLFETIEKIQQIDIDIEQQKKQLTR